MEASLKKACGELASSVSMFDIYRGKGIAEGKKSMAFSVVYRSLDRTLTDDEIDSLHGDAIKKIAEEFSAKTR